MKPTAARLDLTVIRKRLSEARLQRYEREMGGDLSAALELYQWNTEVCAAFYGLLQGVEVVLRNAISEQMQDLHVDRGFNESWFDDPFGLLDSRRLGDIEEACNRIVHDGHVVTHDRIISQLTFGFWRYLLSARYEHTLWVPALRKAFPGLPGVRRRFIAGRVERLHYLRNRIAHHEPIYPRRLDRDVTEAMEVVAAICPTSAGWLEVHSWAPAMLTFGVPGQRVPSP